jgi:minor histocompatibility antigen H13
MSLPDVMRFANNTRPYMLAVATKIDAPMKLIIETGTRSNLLGLGDVAIPALLISLALRFDLWMHYLDRTTYVPEEPRPESQKSDSGKCDQKADLLQPIFTTRRAPYVGATGGWGDWLHTVGLRASASSGDIPARVTASSFAKPYFCAAMVGYATGMIITLAMVTIYQRGQPALLYLVPAIIGSLCITATVRGEWRTKLLYTEDGSIDLSRIKVQLDDQGRLLRFLPHECENASEEEKRPEGSKATMAAEDVFVFRISAPRGRDRG